eukprot:Rhum_TRINITY_DN3552_c0_g2::Rhum_TRINITY_DN3552_c0_g2_i1::g.11195::m.11195
MKSMAVATTESASRAQSFVNVSSANLRNLCHRPAHRTRRVLLQRLQDARQLFVPHHAELHDRVRVPQPRRVRLRQQLLVRLQRQVRALRRARQQLTVQRVAAVAPPVLQRRRHVHRHVRRQLRAQSRVEAGDGGSAAAHQLVLRVEDGCELVVAAHVGVRPVGVDAREHQRLLLLLHSFVELRRAVGAALCPLHLPREADVEPVVKHDDRLAEARHPHAVVRGRRLAAVLEASVEGVARHLSAGEGAERGPRVQVGVQGPHVLPRVVAQRPRAQVHGALLLRRTGQDVPVRRPPAHGGQVHRGVPRGRVVEPRLPRCRVAEGVLRREEVLALVHALHPERTALLREAQHAVPHLPQQPLHQVHLRLHGQPQERRHRGVQPHVHARRAVLGVHDQVRPARPVPRHRRLLAPRQRADAADDDVAAVRLALVQREHAVRRHVELLAGRAEHRLRVAGARSVAEGREGARVGAGRRGRAPLVLGQDADREGEERVGCAADPALLVRGLHGGVEQAVVDEAQREVGQPRRRAAHGGLDAAAQGCRLRLRQRFAGGGLLAVAVAVGGCLLLLHPRRHVVAQRRRCEREVPALCR